MHPSASMQLRGGLLWLIRAGWLLIVAFAIYFAIALAPSYIRDATQNWQVQGSYPAVARIMTWSQYATYFLVLNYAATLVYLGVALFIFARKSDDWLALLVSLTLALVPLGQNWVGYADNDSGLSVPWSPLLHEVYLAVRWIGMLGLLVLVFVFPGGRFARTPPAWLQKLVLALAGLVGAASLLFKGDVFSRLFGITDDYAVFVAIFGIAFGCGVVAQVSSYRSLATDGQKRQVKWLVLGLLSTLIFNLVSVGFYWISGEDTPWVRFLMLQIGFGVAIALPVTVGIAILRHHLWDIDLVIHRALLYSALVACIVLLYGLVVGGLGVLAGSQGLGLLPNLIVIGLIAVLLQPIRMRLQRAVNRLMYGERDDPATVLTRLSQRLESAIAPEAVLSSIVETAAQALKLPYAAIELDTDRGTRAAIGHAPATGLLTLPLVYQSEPVGQFMVAPRSSREAFSPQDRQLLDSIAQQAAVAAHALRLTQDLQHSRERIVSAREEERRRLRRDLHDGLGPTLAAQTLHLDAALDLIDSDPERARAMLNKLKVQTQGVVADVRRLVYELRPPALDELGLVGAIQNYGFQILGMEFAFHVPEVLPPFPAAVEVAVYRIAAEAITNVVRHAHATRCEVGLLWLPASAGNAACLRVEIWDNGCGIPADKPIGLGLRSMRERAEELNGSLSIESSSGQGTRVKASLPIL